jgi:hypothetical protein
MPCPRSCAAYAVRRGTVTDVWALAADSDGSLPSTIFEWLRAIVTYAPALAVIALIFSNRVVRQIFKSLTNPSSSTEITTDREESSPKASGEQPSRGENE